jgi:hypothetical protein
LCPRRANAQSNRYWIASVDSSTLPEPTGNASNTTLYPKLNFVFIRDISPVAGIVITNFSNPLEFVREAISNSITDKKSGVSMLAVSHGHLERIHDTLSGTPPQYDATQQPNGPVGTEIKIFGYNHNDGSKLGHDQLRDYILWFTKFGSIEPLLWTTFQKYAATQGRLGGLRLRLRGLGFDPSKHAGDATAKAETLHFGHIFPQECFDGKTLRERAKAKKASPTDFYCRRFVREDPLKRFPGFRWQAVFSIEGNRVKYENPMVRRQGYAAPPGAYKVAERYGIWVCKDRAGERPSTGQGL